MKLTVAILILCITVYAVNGAGGPPTDPPTPDPAVTPDPPDTPAPEPTTVAGEPTTAAGAGTTKCGNTIYRYRFRDRRIIRRGRNGNNFGGRRLRRFNPGNFGGGRGRIVNRNFNRRVRGRQQGIQVLQPYVIQG
ncbi:hypothetical protein ACFFRR_009054 [Megaselia abdita]